MPEITWDESLPSDSSLVVKGPSHFRSVWRELTTGLSESQYWPGSGGASNASQGELKPGASKAWLAAASASSSAASESHRGKLFLASDVTRLFVYDSTRTYLVGTPFLLEHDTYFANAVWVEKSGSYTTDTGGTFIAGTVSLGGTAYAGVPIVILSSDNTTHRFQADTLTATTFKSNISGPTGSQTYYWTSLGTINT